jgi:hypothetical protein
MNWARQLGSTRPAPPVSQDLVPGCFQAPVHSVPERSMVIGARIKAADANGARSKRLRAPQNITARRALDQGCSAHPGASSCVDNQIRVDQKEALPFVGEDLAPMAHARRLRQLDHRVVQRVKDLVGGFDVVAGPADFQQGSQYRQRNSPRSAWPLPIAIPLRNSANRMIEQPQPFPHHRALRLVQARS